jgi:hypothetical protein
MDHYEEAVWLRWRGLVSEQAASGKRVAAFCGEHDLRTWQFYEWKKRLRDAHAPEFVEVAVRPEAEIAQPTSRKERAIEVRLSKGRSLLVERGLDASHLRALLAVLEGEA